ncbi:MAG: M10 family metallopeptidase C-terminal domain-containing protein [Mycobacteriales bacterium]
MSKTATTDFGSALSAAIEGEYVAQLTGRIYDITSPVVIHVTSTSQGAMGIDGGGATLVSHITDGSPAIQISVDPGVDLRYLTLSNFSIAGNGQEGDGIKIVADGNDRWIYNWSIDNVNVENVGGYGLNVQGSVFEGLVSNSWMNGNAQGGAYFAHSASGGMVSALRWFGGGVQDNGSTGLTLDNGARDISVDGAAFINNNGSGISAMSGITSVTNSNFENNLGAGVTFQNYGNFNNDTFSTTGAQTLGISGYLTGDATLVGNTSTYTGTGSDPTILADLRGPGNVFLTGGSGHVATEDTLTVSGVTEGNLAQVSVGSAGVAIPTLAPVTAATTADMASSTGTDALETALQSAMTGGSVAHLTDDTHTVTAPIVINVTSSSKGPTGIDLGGAKIISQITDGSPVIEIIVGPGVDLGSLTLSNFSIQGNGLEGDGIKIVADGNDRSIHDWSISNVNIEHVGGIGLDVLGNVSQGIVFNSWMHGNGQGGARFANSAGGGETSALDWEGGGFRKNGVAGLILDNGAYDMTVKGAYFVENDGPGMVATSGITHVRETGFENNLGTGAIVQDSANFTDTTFSTHGLQTTAIGGVLAGGQVNLRGVSNEYYEAGWDPTVLANIQGEGTLGIAGGGNVVVGPSVVVTGANPAVVPPGNPAAPSTQSQVMVDDRGASSGDGPTSNPALTAAADPPADAQMLDGSSLADSVSLDVKLDTQGPISVFTGYVVADGQMTLTGTTGGSGDTISLYDGATWLGFATTSNDGNWNFTAPSPANGVVHKYSSNATDIAGNETHGSGELIVGGEGADILRGTAGNDLIVGSSGDRISGGAGADTLTGSGPVTFVYNSVGDTRADASDTIVDFEHGSDKIDFTGIAGINSTMGIPSFQGNITGAGNLTLNAHGVAYIEVAGNTQILVNTGDTAETVSTSDTHAADMKIDLLGVHLGLTSADFQHA